MISYLCGMTDKECKRLQRIRQMEDIGRPVFKWLKEVGAHYKNEGKFPPSLCDFYSSREDKEVAAVVELLIPNRGRRIFYIMELSKILGPSPMEMIKERRFLHLGFPENEKKILKNSHLTYSILFNILDWIWKCSVDLKIPLQHIIKGEKDIVKPAHIYPLRDIFNVKDLDYRIDMLLAKMCLPDGYGEGLWNIKEELLSYPFSKTTQKLMSAFFAVRGDTTEETIKRAIRLLDVPLLEMLYVEWGYASVCKKDPNAVARLERLYRKRFEAMYSYSQPYKLVNILPEIL